MTPLTMIFLLLSVVVLALILKSVYAKGKYLKTETVHADEIQGLFTLTLYGGNDPKQAVFLDIEEDGYTFEINDSRHTFTVTRGVAAEQALHAAIDFLDAQNHRISKILYQKRTIGYEIRPVYQTVQYGSPDILDIRYRMEDKKVHVSVNIKRAIRKSYERDRYS